jgi:ferredoxin
MILRRLRVCAAWAVFIAATLLLLDFTGALHAWLGWIARVQLVPAVLAVNIAALVVVAVVTLVFGRLYCSVLCPLGIMQDGVSWASGRGRTSRRKTSRKTAGATKTASAGSRKWFAHSRPLTWLRYGLLVIFVVAMVAGISVVVSLLDPWGAYGRIAQNLFAPVWRLGNNLLAWVAERADSYAFYAVDVWVRSGIAFAVAAVWLVGVAVLAWSKGRLYCNSVCPVGTLLGLISRGSILRVAIDADKCTRCGVCEKRCKSSCIDSKAATVDRSRCVVCFDCLEGCKAGAISYSGCKKKSTDNTTGLSRRKFLSIAAVAAATPAALKAQQVERILLQVDGGLANIADKQRPDRKTPITPPGSFDARHMRQNCTACQLCVAACPSGVLGPSSRLATQMQPEMTFEHGYCRPECVECAAVCPSSAIKKITTAEKTEISVGTAHWNSERCVVLTDKVPCTECQRHCPTGAITLVAVDPDEAAAEAAGTRRRNAPQIRKTPVVDIEKCIGCGACEHLCPARPLAAIHVEGYPTHHSELIMVN